MGVRRLAAIILVPLLAAPPMASVAGAAPQPPSAGALQLEVQMSLTLWICGALFGAVVSWVVSEVLTAIKNRWKR